MQRRDPLDHIGPVRRIGQVLRGPGVCTNVGATALTVIPCGPHSTARHKEHVVGASRGARDVGAYARRQRWASKWAFIDG